MLIWINEGEKVKIQIKLNDLELSSFSIDHYRFLLLSSNFLK